ncbi:MAG: protein kinase [Thermodesulfobacteriota bacterium]
MDETTKAKDFLKLKLKSRYTVGDFKGKGGAGITFILNSVSTNITRIAKILRPSVAESEHLLKVKEDFISEGKKLSFVHHPNLPIIYDFYHKYKYPFYITDYIPGHHLIHTTQKLAKKMINGRWINELFEYSKQLFQVLNYLHNCKPRSILHLDIKPENYLINLKKRSGYLIDFGIARYSKETSDSSDVSIAIRGTFPLWPTKYHKYLKHLTDENRSLFFINRNLLKQSLDLHLAARTIKMAIEAGLAKDGVDATWEFQILTKYRLMQSISNILDIDQSDVELSYTAEDVCKWFEQGKIHDKRASNLFDYGLIKVPGTFIDTFGNSVKSIMDTKEFQRLRGLKQLGFTYLVYPGAKHDRHEHSLGTFHNALCYLDQLSSQNVDFKFRSSMTDEYIVATALLALLHDVGHSPFGHQLTIRGKYPDHEKRTLAIIRNDTAIREAIEKNFNEDICQCCIELMEYIYNSDHQKAVAKTEPIYHVLKAILSSAIDVDKLDYIMRDSVHCGVPYGSIVDKERLISSLRVWYSPTKEPTLVISDKGRACAEAIVFARYILTSEVYWNHAVRAFSAMLSSAITDLDPNQVKQKLNNTDEEFLIWLRSKRETKWFFSYFDIRKPYKRAFVLQRKGGSADTEESGSELFNRLEDALLDKAAYSIVSDAVKAVLNIGDNCSRHDIVLDIPEGMTKVTGIHVLPEGHDKPDLISPIYSSIADMFDNVSRKARIFIRPDLLGSRSLIESNDLIRKALCEKYGINT